MLDSQTQMTANILWQEFKELKDNPEATIGVSVGLVDKNDIFTWRCTLMGPVDSPYKGGLFYLKVLFPHDYPQSPPDVRFVTPIYHVNINQKNSMEAKVGHVCISSLNFWVPGTRIKRVLTDIFALCYNGNADSAYGFERGVELRTQEDLYKRKIEYFTKIYASPHKGYLEYPNDWDFSYPLQGHPIN